MKELEGRLADDGKIYETIANELYGLGRVLISKKYRFLRWSYICFVTGAVLCGVQIATLAILGRI